MAIRPLALRRLIRGAKRAATLGELMRGAPIKAVQELVGHATIMMTMRYAHLAPEIARDAVRLFDGHAKAVAKNAAS